MVTIGSFFSGGEGVGIGAKGAGIQHLWGIEIKDKIAAVARLNGFNVITADVTKIDFDELETPDVFHASPVCVRASTVNGHGQGEATIDIETAMAVVNYITAKRPKIVTVENVWNYRKFQAFKAILTGLESCGYTFHFKRYNSADFGVAQARVRLILYAMRGQSMLPQIVPTVEKWNGWWSVLHDIVESFEDSTFVPWQKVRLPEEINESFIMVSNTTGFARARVGDGICFKHQPSKTLTAAPSGNRVNGFIIGDRKNENYPDPPREWIKKGRVCRLPVRALARLQSFPDWYQLPPNNISLGQRIIGNSIPPLMYQELIKQIIK